MNKTLQLVKDYWLLAVLVLLLLIACLQVSLELSEEIREIKDEIEDLKDEMEDLKDKTKAGFSELEKRFDIFIINKQNYK